MYGKGVSKVPLLPPDYSYNLDIDQIRWHEQDLLRVALWRRICHRWHFGGAVLPPVALWNAGSATPRSGGGTSITTLRDYFLGVTGK